jgi:hypothetical protein
MVGNNEESGTGGLDLSDAAISPHNPWAARLSERSEKCHRYQMETKVPVGITNQVPSPVVKYRGALCEVPVLMHFTTYYG